MDIEKKWNELWSQKKVFESNPKNKQKKYLTAAFPYPNSPQHIGHARTYTTTDIYARYLRHCGYNVLFPMAFHVTGTPILAMAKRIEKKDESVLAVFEKIYEIPRETAQSLIDPVDLVTYFSKEIESGMREMGFSIDWRRSFYTYDKKFNKFIEWQFKKLKELGYLVKGSYPIAWCPADGNALSAHDTKGDVDPEIENVTVIKFKSEENFFVVTTYRPETIYGVTNLWINPNEKYVLANFKGERIILANNAAKILGLQLGLEVIQEINVEKLLEMKATNPINGENVPIFPASFVSPDIGTGVVMSVPAHAPLDYLALIDLGKAEKIPQVIKLSGYSDAPARDAVQKYKVKNQNDPESEKATKEIYALEAREGVMLVGKYIGKKVADAKELIGADLKSTCDAFEIITLSNGPIFCRCGSLAVVNILDDQWFIDYGIPEWKEKAKKCLEKMNCIPEKSRNEFLYTIDWLKTRPTTRSSGLGTKFPFDQSKVIEALSDSTLYMSYYTISHLIENINSEDLNESFFDYVFLGKGQGNEFMEKLRESFLYWYPVDSRHSASDLVRNHLSLYIFNHVGIYPEKLWPNQIVTNGFVTMEGSKMSKSMGNILPLRKAIRDYGADVIRFSVVCGADLATDSDFNKSVADGVKSRLALISKLIDECKDGEKKRIDLWLLSRLNQKIKNSYELYEQVAIRHLALEIFYDVIADLQWYLKRSDSPNLKTFFKKWVILISPFMPHYSEEFWEKLGNKPFIANVPFPSFEENANQPEIELGEELVKKTYEDIEKISAIIGKKPELIKIFIASDWKRQIYELVRKHKKFDLVMKEASELGLPMKDASTTVKQLLKNAHSLPAILNSKNEMDSIMDASVFLSKEFNCEILVLNEEEGGHDKAKSALPGKPSIAIL